jgi:TonB family protein
MTTRRLIASVAVSATVLALTAVFVVRSFPLEARAPRQAARTVETGTGPVQIVQGGEHLLHGSVPEYPKRAIEQQLTGDVSVAVTIDERGEVVDARVLSGPEEFRRATLQAVLQWHYEPASLGNREMQVTLRFRVPSQTEEPRERKYFAESLNELDTSTTRIERQMLELEKAMADPSVSESQKEEYKHKYAELKATLAHINSGNPSVAGTEAPWRLVQIRSERVPQTVLTQVMRQLNEQFNIGVGDTINEVTAKRMAGAVRSIDEHLAVRYSRNANGDVVMTIIAP